MIGQVIENQYLCVMGLVIIRKKKEKRVDERRYGNKKRMKPKKINDYLYYLSTMSTGSVVSLFGSCLKQSV